MAKPRIDDPAFHTTHASKIEGEGITAGGAGSDDSGSPEPTAAAAAAAGTAFDPDAPLIFNRELFPGCHKAVLSRIIPAEKLKPIPGLCINIIQAGFEAKKDGLEILQVADAVMSRYRIGLAVNARAEKTSDKTRFISGESLKILRKSFLDNPILRELRGGKINLLLVGHYYDSHACAEPIMAAVLESLAAIGTFEINKINILSCNAAKPVRTAAEEKDFEMPDDAVVVKPHKALIPRPDLREDTLQNKVARACVSHGIRTRIVATNSLIYPHFSKVGDVHSRVITEDLGLEGKTVTIRELLERHPAAGKHHTALILNHRDLRRTNALDGKSASAKLFLTPDDVVVATGATKIVYDLTHERK